MLPLLLAVVCMSEGCGGRTEENGQTEILENSVSEAAQDSGGEERMDGKYPLNLANYRFHIFRSLIDEKTSAIFGVASAVYLVHVR